jgi:hypothetical protein
MSVAKTLQRVKQFIPPLSSEMHKGQAGRVGVIGGSEEYPQGPPRLILVTPVPLFIRVCLVCFSVPIWVM